MWMASIVGQNFVLKAKPASLYARGALEVPLLHPMRSRVLVHARQLIAAEHDVLCRQFVPDLARTACSSTQPRAQRSASGCPQVQSAVATQPHEGANGASHDASYKSKALLWSTVSAGALAAGVLSTREPARCDDAEVLLATAYSLLETLSARNAGRWVHDSMKVCVCDQMPWNGGTNRRQLNAGCCADWPSTDTSTLDRRVG
jgi:hypothetical protein